MLFFRTISLVAALAFATLSSAAPVEGAGLVGSGDVFARDVSEVALPVKRGGSITDSYNTCHQSVSEIIIDINVAVKAGNQGDILIGLNKIVVELNILIVAVKGYGIVDLDISVFAAIVFGLVQIIANVCIGVININADITLCISQIGGLLGTLLSLTLDVVVGLDIVLSVLLGSLGGILNTLGYLHIFIGIGLSISL